MQGRPLFPGLFLNFWGLGFRIFELLLLSIRGIIVVDGHVVELIDHLLHLGVKVLRVLRILHHWRLHTVNAMGKLLDWLLHSIRAVSEWHLL